MQHITPLRPLLRILHNAATAPDTTPPLRREPIGGPCVVATPHRRPAPPAKPIGPPRKR